MTFGFERNIGNHDDAVVSIKYSNDKKFFASASADKTVHIYNCDTWSRKTVLVGHDLGLNSVEWLNTSTGFNLATASDDKTVQIWDIEKSTAINILTGHKSYAYCLAAHPYQNLLLSGSYDETVKLWDTRCTNQNSICTIHAHSAPIKSIDYSHTGLEFVTVADDGYMRLWDARMICCRQSVFMEGIGFTGNNGGGSRTRGSIHNLPISNIRYSPNSKFVLMSSLDDCIRLWRLRTASEDTDIIREYRNHRNDKFGLTALFMMSNGKDVIISGSEDGQIYIWDMQTTEVIQVLQNHTDVVLAIDECSERGEIISGGGSDDCRVKLWRQQSIS